MKTVGERLRWAIENYGPPQGGRPGNKGGIRQFHETMKELAESGAIPEADTVTYQMLHRYLPKGSNPDPSLPSEDFLKAAAEVLSRVSGERVRWEWLADGEDPPTMRVEDEAEIPAFQREIFHGLGMGADSAPYPWTEALAEVRRRFRAGHPIFPLDAPRVEAEHIGNALRGPLAALGVDPELMTYDALNDYILSMVPVLLALAPEHERQTRYSHEEKTDG